MVSLDTLLDDAAEFLRAQPSVTLVSHIDADGICATAILSAALEGAGIPVTVRFIAQASKMAFERIGQETEGAIAFVDLGSSHLDAIATATEGRLTLIIDHHQVHGTAHGALLCSPVVAGLDGTRVVSAAGLALEIARRLAPSTVNRSLPIALIGAQADNQELGAFVALNRSILEEGIAAGLVRTRSGARLHGVETKPVLDLVAFSYDLRIEGVTRDKDGARRLLRKLDIRDPERRRWKDLTPDEQDRLDEELLLRSANPQARVTHYSLPGMPPGPLRDTREASTLLNACGRLGRPEVAVRMLLGDTTAIREAREVQRAYRTAVQDAHRWFKDARSSGDEDVSIRGEYAVVRARDRVAPDIAGTLCSVLTKGEEVPRGTVVVCLARNMDGTDTTKVSSRALEPPIDLSRLMRECAEAVGGEGGGHPVAAGAIIPTDAEDAFVDRIHEFFS